MGKNDTILEENKGLALLEASDPVKKMEENVRVSPAAATAGAARGGGAGAGRRKGIRLRNSRPLLVATSRALLGPPAAVCATIPGRSFRTAGEVSILRFSVFCPKGMR